MSNSIAIFDQSEILRLFWFIYPNQDPVYNFGPKIPASSYCQSANIKYNGGLIDPFRQALPVVQLAVYNNFLGSQAKALGRQGMSSISMTSSLAPCQISPTFSKAAYRAPLILRDAAIDITSVNDGHGQAVFVNLTKGFASSSTGTLSFLS